MRVCATLPPEFSQTMLQSIGDRREPAQAAGDSRDPSPSDGGPHNTLSCNRKGFFFNYSQRERRDDLETHAVGLAEEDRRRGSNRLVVQRRARRRARHRNAEMTRKLTAFARAELAGETRQHMHALVEGDARR